MDNTAKVTILSQVYDASGATPETALALVLVEDLTAQESAAVKAIKISKSQEDARYCACTCTIWNPPYASSDYNCL
jgi:hypothetical protein